MKHLYLFSLLTVLAVGPALAQTDSYQPRRTDDGASRGFSIGARAAYAWPFGDIVKDAKLSDSFDRMIPLWLDATLRLGGGLEVGPYFSYGWISGKNGSGDAKDWRLGGQLNYRLTPAAGFAPWIGVGAGWEWVKFDNSNGDVSGPEVMLQGGADFRLGANLAVGPFVSLSAGRFSSGRAFDVASAAGVSIDKAWHEWVQIGAKVTFDL